MLKVNVWNKKHLLIERRVFKRFSLWPHVLVCSTVDQELGFQDKYLFYRFLDDEEEDTPLPSEEEKRESEDELPETILFLAQIGPDALLRMILRKSSVTTAICASFSCWALLTYTCNISHSANNYI